MRAFRILAVGAAALLSPRLLAAQAPPQSAEPGTSSCFAQQILHGTKSSQLH